MKRTKKANKGKMSQMVVFLLVLLALALTPAIVTAVPTVVFEKWDFEVVLTIEITPFEQGGIEGWMHQYTFDTVTDKPDDDIDPPIYEILRVDVGWGSSNLYPTFEQIAPLGYGFGNDDFTEIGTELISSSGTSIYDDGSTEYKTKIELASPVGEGDTIESFYIVYQDVNPELMEWQWIRMFAQDPNSGGTFFGLPLPPIQETDYQQALYSEADYPIPAAVPEPGTILLLGSGLIASWGILSRRRMRKK